MFRQFGIKAHLRNEERPVILLAAWEENQIARIGYAVLLGQRAAIQRGKILRRFWCGLRAGFFGSRSVGVRLGVALLFEPLDFFLETLNRGILFLQVLDSLIQSTVLLKQGFRVAFRCAFICWVFVLTSWMATGWILR